MKPLLFISTMNGSPWGGSEEFWFRMAVWLAEKNYPVECCFFEWTSQKEEKANALRSAGCVIHRLPNPKAASNKMQKLLIKEQVKNKLRNICKKEYALVCISQGGYLDVTYPLFNRLLKRLNKYVLIHHNYSEFDKISDTRKRSLHRWITSAALNLVASEKVAENLLKVAGFALPNKQILFNPITITQKTLPENWPAIPDSGNYVWVVLAELATDRKAQDILITALATEKWKARNWQLDIYGEGENKISLDSLIQSLKIGSKIKLKGRTNQVETVLKNAHLLLQITHIDAMPLSVTEAMNMARPCIVSAVGDMPRWICDGVNGFVTPLVTVNAIDQVLEKAWNQKESWESMGKEAFKTFREKYPRPYEPFYESVFKKLMEPKTS